MATMDPVPAHPVSASSTIGHYVTFRDEAPTAEGSLSHWSPTLNPAAAAQDPSSRFQQITPSLTASVRPKDAAVRSPIMSAAAFVGAATTIMGPPSSPSLVAVPAAPPASPPFEPNLSPLQQPISRISPGISPTMSPGLSPHMLPPPAVLVDQLPVNSAFASAISLATTGAPLPIHSHEHLEPSGGLVSTHGDMGGGSGALYAGVAMDTDSAAAQSPSPHAVSIAFSPTQLTRLADQPVEPLALPNPYMPFPMSYPYTTCDANSQRRFITTASGPLYKTAKQKAPARSKAKPAGARGGNGRKGGAANGEKPTRRFCHICRSPKEVSKIVSCCSGKQSHVFCAGCVHRRLKLSFEELVARNDWLCPKCENRCPCSKCRKRTPLAPNPPNPHAH